MYDSRMYGTLEYAYWYNIYIYMHTSMLYRTCNILILLSYSINHGVKNTRMHAYMHTRYMYEIVAKEKYYT